MFAQTDPKTLVKWLIAAAIVYLVLPYDLFPDFFGVPGRIDDLLVLAWLAWFYRNHVRQYVARSQKSEKRSESGSEKDRGASGSWAGAGAAFDAYAVLGIAPSASDEAIRAAYRARMQEYHPDKVAHLGEELRALAHEKTQQIQRAYQQLHE